MEGNNRERVGRVERVVHRGEAVGGRHGDETTSVAEKAVLHVKRAPDERGVDNVRVLDGERVRELTMIVFEVFAQTEVLRSAHVRQCHLERRRVVPDGNRERGRRDPNVDVALHRHDLDRDRRVTRGIERFELKGPQILTGVLNDQERLVVGGDEVLESARGRFGGVEVRGDVEGLRPAGEDDNVRNGRHQVRTAERGPTRSHSRGR